MPDPAPAGAAAAPPSCPNCGVAVSGRFCPGCGQDLHHDLRRPIRRFLAELVEETLSLDGRLLRTVPAVLFRPGRVAADLAAGRRARYTTPLKLYLGASLVLFLAMAGGRSTVHFRVASGGTELLRTGQQPRFAPEIGNALRSRGRIGAFYAEHLDRLAALPPAEADRRMNDAFDEAAPRALFVLVPALALLLKLAYPRRFYAEHLALALHAQSVAFLAMAPSALTGWAWLEGVGEAVSALWAILALRRVYGRGWAATLLRFAGVAIAYLALLVLAIGAAGIASLAQM